MNPTITGTGLVAVSQELGVHDLPMQARAFFSKALMAERRGDTVAAQEFLEKAAAAEAALAPAQK